MSEFQTKVNELVGQMVQGEDGKWALPEEVVKDLDEPTRFAVTAERRYRDTQSAFTKSQQELKKQAAIAKGLEEKFMSSEAPLTKEQKFELNDLKKTNPEAWRAKLNEYEQTNKANLKAELDEIAKSSANKTELEIRQEQMAAWSESTGIVLNDEVVKNELPPKFIKELEDGKVTFAEFLEKAGNFIKAEKVVQGSEEPAQDDDVDMTKLPGGREPSNTAKEGDFNQTYEKTLF